MAIYYILYIMMIILTVLIIINTFIFLLNQKELDDILISNEIYLLENDTQKAIKINNIVYDIVPNKSINKTQRFFCNTPRSILYHGGACGDKTLLEISLLHNLDIESHPVGLYNKDGIKFAHVIVEVNVDNKILYLDPSKSNITYDLNNTLYINPETFKPFNHIVSYLIRNTDIQIYQPYFMLRCDTRNIITLSILIIITHLLLFIQEKRIIKLEK